MITPCAANRATNVHPHAVCNDYVTDKTWCSQWYHIVCHQSAISPCKCCCVIICFSKRDRLSTSQHLLSDEQE